MTKTKREFITATLNAISLAGDQPNRLVVNLVIGG